MITPTDMCMLFSVVATKTGIIWYAVSNLKKYEEKIRWRRWRLLNKMQFFVSVTTEWTREQFVVELNKIKMKVIIKTIYGCKEHCGIWNSFPLDCVACFQECAVVQRMLNIEKIERFWPKHKNSIVIKGAFL